MQIQNADATQIIRDQAKLTVAEGFPQNLLTNVQPVMDMTPRFHRNLKFISGSATASSSSTNIFNVPSDQSVDTYVVGIVLSFYKDSTCDTATGTITLGMTPENANTTQSIIRLPILTLTQQNETVVMTFERPIKLKKGTTVPITAGTFTVGNFIRTATVLYYDTQ